jgi:hypothetical protein
VTEPDYDPLDRTDAAEGPEGAEGTERPADDAVDDAVDDADAETVHDAEAATRPRPVTLPGGVRAYELPGVTKLPEATYLVGGRPPGKPEGKDPAGPPPLPPGQGAVEVVVRSRPQKVGSQVYPGYVAEAAGYVTTPQGSPDEALGRLVFEHPGLFGASVRYIFGGTA